jgi:hypothetical protein
VSRGYRPNYPKIPLRVRRRINKRLPRGVHVSIYRYARIHAGPDRGMYQHRAIIRQLDAEGPCGLVRPLSEVHVHHLDFNTLHNCAGNFLVCDPAINEFMANDSKRVKRELKSNKPE